jgi:hypothetical protein
MLDGAALRDVPRVQADHTRAAGAGQGAEPAGGVGVMFEPRPDYWQAAGYAALVLGLCMSTWLWMGMLLAP